MKKYLLTLTTFLTLTLAHSQTQVIFQKTFGTISPACNARDAQQTSDGGYIITGSSGPYTDWDIFLSKFDNTGNITWTRLYGNSSNDFSESVKQTSDGGYIIVGTYRAVQNGGYDYLYLIKTDSNGDTLWTKKTGNPPNYYYGFSIQQTIDGGYIIAGKMAVGLTNNHDIFLMKTNSTGNMLWSKTYGGTGVEECNSVQQTIDGGYILAGHTYSFGAGGSDVYLIKTNNNGDLSWSKTYGSAEYDYGYSVKQAQDGGYIIAGQWGITRNAYLIKIDNNGNVDWSKDYGATGWDDSGNAVQQTIDGGYIIAGITHSFVPTDTGNVYLIKTNSFGDTLWTNSFGGTGYDFSNSVEQTDDRGYIVAGFSTTFSGSGTAYLVKTDSLGNGECNQYNTNTVVGNPATITGSPATQVSSSGVTSNTLTTIGSGGALTTHCISVSMTETSEEKTLNIYPNPSSSKTILQTDKVLKNATLTLYNALGQQVRQVNNISGQTVTLHRDNLTSGLYYLQLTQGNQTIATDKLVITD